MLARIASLRRARAQDWRFASAPRQTISIPDRPPLIRDFLALLLSASRCCNSSAVAINTALTADPIYTHMKAPEYKYVSTIPKFSSAQEIAQLALRDDSRQRTIQAQFHPGEKKPRTVL